MKYFLAVLGIFLFGNNLLAGISKAPSFELPSIDGKTYKLDSLIKEGVVVIDFWATWCKYCDDELDLLHKLRKEMGDSSFILVGISIDSHRSISRVKAMAKAHKWDFPILLDSSKRVKQKYRVIGLPTIFVINQKGEIVQTRMGYNPSQEEDLKKIIKNALKTGSEKEPGEK